MFFKVGLGYTWVRFVCLSVCCVCLGSFLLFVAGPPFLLGFGSLRSGFLFACGVFVGVWLPPGWASSWVPCWFLPCVGVRRFFLWGFPMLSFSSLPAFASVGPVSSVPAAPVRAPVSLSPLLRVSWGGPVVLERLGWEASSSSVLVWVVGSSSPVVCRVGSSAPVAVSALVAELRRLVRSGEPCRLGVRGSWGGRWFCAVAPV